MRICRKCGVEKVESDFRTRPGHAITECQKCEAQWRKEYYQQNPEKCRDARRIWARKHPENSRKRLYGISDEQYKKMLLNQEGGCAICGRKTKLCVDHCHLSLKIRGILCVNCNLGIGNFKDSIELLLKAGIYLEKSKVD